MFCASIIQWLRYRPVAADTRVQFPVGALGTFGGFMGVFYFSELCRLKLKSVDRLARIEMLLEKIIGE
jgi:hypothetical protein